MALRIGMIGVGFGTTVHVPAFQSEGLEVVAICARRHERAEEAAGRYGIEQVFTDYEAMLAMDGLDAVSIATPAALHAEMAIAALSAGKHLICEKPFALDAAEARQMWQAASASGTTAMVAHEFRFASARARAKELIDEGFVGRPRLGVVQLLRGPSTPRPEPAEFRADRDAAASGAGFLFGLGSHYIDGLRHLLGEVVAVSGTLATLDAQRRSDTGTVLADADDTFSFTLEFASGAVVHMIASRVAPFGSTASIEIYGDEGTLRTPQRGFNPPPHGILEGARLGDAGGLAPLPIPERLEPFADERDERLMPFRLFTQQFVEGVATSTSPAPNFFDGYRCQLVLDAVRASATSGTRVELEAVG